LTEERIDVGVRIGELADSSLFAVKVGEIRNVACASPDYLERKGMPKTPQDLSNHDGVRFGNLIFSWIEPGGETLREAPLNVRVQANDVTAACAAAAEGLGISRLPSYMIVNQLKSGALVEILRDYAPKPLPVHLVYVKQGLLPLKVRAFIDWMTPRLRQTLKTCWDVAP
jgi:DNA-binding transcriptional LysR family regulator